MTKKRSSTSESPNNVSQSKPSSDVRILFQFLHLVGGAFPTAAPTIASDRVQNFGKRAGKHNAYRRQTCAQNADIDLDNRSIDYVGLISSRVAALRENDEEVQLDHENDRYTDVDVKMRRSQSPRGARPQTSGRSFLPHKKSSKSGVKVYHDAGQIESGFCVIWVTDMELASLGSRPSLHHNTHVEIAQH